MSTYRLLNTDNGTYITLSGNVHDNETLVNALTTTDPDDLGHVADLMRNAGHRANYQAVHGNGSTHGDDWVAIARRHAGTYQPNPAHATEVAHTSLPRTYRVIITDSPTPGVVGDYVVSSDPTIDTDSGTPHDFTSAADARAAIVNFSRMFTGTSYYVVSRYGVTWDEIADNVRSDWQRANAPTCAAFTCGAPATDGDYCEGHAGSLPCDCHECRPPTPRRRRRDTVCREDGCRTGAVHHDDIDEVFLCDHLATERIDAGYPVTTAYAIPA